MKRDIYLLVIITVSYRKLSCFYYYFVNNREVIQTFYDSRVRDKLVFVTEDDYLDVLEKYLNRAHLPAVIDPVQGKGQPMPGYFENVKMEGGRIPRQVLKTP